MDPSTLPCDLCGSSSSKVVLEGTDHREQLGGTFLVRRCLSCSLVRTDPRPADLAAWYPASYQQHNAPDGITTKAVAWAIRAVASGRVPSALARLLVRAVPDAALGGPVPPGARVLDVGAGNGNAVLALARAGVDAHGLEPSREAVGAARARGIATVTVGTLEDSPLEPESWDLVRMCQVLEHVASPSGALRRIRPALVPGGRLVIGVPNFDGAARRLAGRSWDGLELPRHLHHFSATTLRRLLEQTGYEVVSIRSVALFGVLPATLDALTTGGRRQRGWRRSLALRGLFFPAELALALAGGGDGIVAVARPAGAPLS